MIKKNDFLQKSNFFEEFLIICSEIGGETRFFIFYFYHLRVPEAILMSRFHEILNKM